MKVRTPKQKQKLQRKNFVCVCVNSELLSMIATKQRKKTGKRRTTERKLWQVCNTKNTVMGLSTKKS